jgi:hypothetical protein
MHRGAAGQRQRRGRLKIDAGGQCDKSPRGNADLFCEATILLNSEQDRLQTHGFLAALTIGAGAAKEIRLHRNLVTRQPPGHVFAHFKDASGNFTAWRPREFKRDRQLAPLQPEIEMVQSARLNLHDHFSTGRLRVGNIAQLELTWPPMGDELNSLHKVELNARTRMRKREWSILNSGD